MESDTAPFGRGFAALRPHWHVGCTQASAVSKGVQLIPRPVKWKKLVNGYY